MLRCKVYTIMCISLAFQACSFYNPGIIRQTHFDDEHRYQVNASLGNNMDLGINISPIDKLGFTYNFSSTFPYQDSIGYDPKARKTIYWEGRNFEHQFALGYYNNLWKKFSFQLYAGHAFGESSKWYSEPIFFFTGVEEDFLLKSDFQRNYLQIGLTYQTGEHSYLSLVNSYSYLQNFNFNGNKEEESLNVSFKPSNHWLEQLAFHFSIDIDEFTAFGQLQSARSLNAVDRSNYFSVREIGIFIGLGYSFDHLFTKVRSPKGNL